MRSRSSLLEKMRFRLSRTSNYVSSLFVIPIKTGGFRPVVNLKPLNKNILYRHFKMEGTTMLKHLLKRGDWMVKIDLQDAYLTVPILPSNCHFLQFEWKGTQLAEYISQILLKYYIPTIEMLVK
jgi:hypothetical protein